MRAGVMLAEWFRHEAQRLYGALAATEEEQEQDQLVQWIASRGGRVTVRETQTFYRKLKAPGLAAAALEGLVQGGLGSWQNAPATPSGGRPARVFVLATPQAPAKPSQGKPSAKPLRTQEILSFADADTTEERKITPRPSAMPSPELGRLAESASPAPAALGADEASELGTEGEV
jgi:hypothetical protein